MTPITLDKPRVCARRPTGISRFWNIERVDNTVVTNAQTIPIGTGEMMMREIRKSQSQLVDFGLYSVANKRWKFEECAVETGVINLNCGAHPESQGFRTRGLIPAFISCSDSRIADSNSGENSF